MTLTKDEKEKLLIDLICNQHNNRRNFINTAKDNNSKQHSRSASGYLVLRCIECINFVS